MRTKTKIILLSIALLLNMSMGFAQWQTNTPGGFNDISVITDYNAGIAAVGIGDFLNNPYNPNDFPKAALDICIPYLYPSNGDWVENPGNLGEAIHTSANIEYDHFWRMYQYVEKHPGTEVFHIENYRGDNSIELNVVQSGYMEFFTNNTHWMRLREQGNLGLSNTWGSFNPLSLVHMNQSGLSNLFTQYTNGNTGWTSTDYGFHVGLQYHSGYPGGDKSFAKLIQKENAPMKFYTNNTDRMIINATYNPTIHSVSVNTTGYVGIGEANFWGEETGGEGPRSLVHLQGPYNAWANGGLGWRSWNKTGIYMNENSDEIYLGLKNEFSVNGTNRSDAVLMWGDDQYSVSEGTADNFRLIFSGASSNGNGNGGSNPRDPATMNGLEVMRATPFGKMGIGPLFTWGTPPAKRLELLDVQNSSGTSLSEAQLRLTYTQATAGSLNTTGKWTDLQATSNGDLYINPKNASTSQNVGISTNTPNDKLEINSNDASATSAGGNSGLLFTDLTTSSTINSSAFAGSPKGVLSVNSVGKVILVEDQGSGVGDVKACTSDVDNWVTKWSNSSINEICNSQIFDNGTNVSVGYTGSPTPNQKLDVNGDIDIPLANAYYISNAQFLKSLNGTDIELGFNAGPTGANSNYQNIFIGTGTGNDMANSEQGNILVGHFAGDNLVSSVSGESSYNVYIGNSAGSGNSTASYVGSSNTFIGNMTGGQFSFLTGFNQNTAIGAHAGNQSTDVGERNTLLGYNSHVTNGGSGQIDNAVAIGHQVYAGSDNAFVCGNADNQILMGYSVTPTSVTNGTYTSTDCRLYVTPRTGSSDAAYFNGNIILSGAVHSSSDAALKQNIKPISENISQKILNQIEPKSYTFDQSSNKSLKLPTGIQYGVIADEVEKTLPGLVKEFTAPGLSDAFGKQITPDVTFKTVNYTGFVPLLIASAKEQQNKIASLENRIDSLLNVQVVMNSKVDMLLDKITDCCSGTSHKLSNPSQDVELSNAIILNQNDPNPFAEETRITYFIPEGISDAKIIFFDTNGRILRTVKISERGEGQLNVYASNLTSGIYSYSLVVDGKVMETKKMVCNK